MKILLYNWVTYDDAEGRGGGVRVYHENLVATLAAVPGIQVYTLSSGIRYDLFDRRPRIRKNSAHRGVASYEVVNSPVVAPAHAAFHSLDLYLEDTSLKIAVEEFLDRHGPFDVIQFDNLEGLTAGVLELKERYPATRFIYYLHNYNLFCPQVNLWYAGSTACVDYDDGKRCVGCLPNSIRMRDVKIAYAISGALQRVGIRPDSWVFRTIYKNTWLAKRVLRMMGGLAERFMSAKNAGSSRTSFRLDGWPTSGPDFTGYSAGMPFRQYRERNITIVNRHFDLLLAVSYRVGEIAVRHGVDAAKVKMVRIGTGFAERRIPIRVTGNDLLKIAYMGYERKDKGFYHFLDALENLPDCAAKRISVLVAAGIRKSGTRLRLQRLAAMFGNIEIVDGYDHADLEHLLEDVDLGVVPVLWEDNLPQVAMEFIAHGIPVLSSDLGGARELCFANPRFVYRHDQIDDLNNRLLHFVDNRSALQDYEVDPHALVGISQHVDRLLAECYPATATKSATPDNIEPLTGDPRQENAC